MSEEYYDPTDLMDVALDRTKRIYSGFYEQLDKTGEKERLNFFKDAKASSDTVWSELVKYYKKNGMSLNDKLTISMMASRLCAFYHWKEHRKLYIFDEDSVNEIMLSYVGNKEIDSDFFTKLPFNGMCMYVPSKQNHMNNCIIIYRDETSVDGLALNICSFTIPNLIKEYNRELHWRSMTVLREYKLVLNDGELIKDNIYHISGEVKEGYKSYCLKVLSLFLYILEENNDPKYKGTYIPKLDIQWIDRPEDVVDDEPLKAAIGRTISRSKNEEDNAREKRELDVNKTYIRMRPKAPRIPHMRAGHWHHYWYGPKDSDNRELIARWVEPVHVNMNRGAKEAARSNKSKVTT